jgi:ABC-type Fe3+ transport system permease subunit
MILVIFLSVVITLTILLATKRLLPRIPNWLTITFLVIVPPGLYVIYSIYQSLVEIGKYEAINGAAPPNAVEGFYGSMTEALLGGAVWAVLALAVSLIMTRRRPAKPDPSVFD